ncbi:MAG: hypothetical protein QW075_00550 [Thermofilaceae archaeon]
MEKGYLGSLDCAAVLEQVMRRLTAESRKYRATDLENPVLYFEATEAKGKVEAMPFIVLKSRGCSWKLKHGGCTMCGYNFDSTLGDPVSESQLLHQLSIGLKRAVRVRPTIIAVTPAGSFFDPEELPREVAFKIVDAVRKLGSLRVLYIESRPEYGLQAAEDSFLDELLDRLKPLELSVGIGLESADDFVRNCIIHKGVSLRIVEKAVKALQERGVHTVLYTLLKPAFLTEREAVEDSISSVKWAASRADRVVLFPLRVYPYTLNWLLWRKGEYRTPWLWSLVEVLERLAPWELEKLIVTGWGTPPPTRLQAYNCSECTSAVKQLLKRWNASRDPSYIREAKNLSCSCVDEWRRELQQKSGCMREKIEVALSELGLFEVAR